jgi:hypothetical protein
MVETMKVILAEERLIQTRKGITIGGAYIRRPPHMSEDAEQMQRLLLNHHRISVRETMPRLPRHRANVIPTHSGLLARLWEKVRASRWLDLFRWVK